MIVYPSWDHLCGDCGRTNPAGTWCFHGEDPNRPDPNPAATARSWLFLLDRNVTDAVEFAHRDPAYFRRWRRTLKNIDARNARRVARIRRARMATRSPSRDVTGVRAVRNGAVRRLRPLPGTTAYDHIIRSLLANGYRVERVYVDQAQAQCPAHDDDVASLSVGRGRDCAVLDCKAGCTPRNVPHRCKEVMAGIGLEEYHMFDNSYPDPSLNGEIKITKVRS